MVKHLISITDLDKKSFLKIIKTAISLKKNPSKYKNTFSGKTMAMIFEKPSLRTRLSFEAGMTQMRGHAIYLSPSDISMGKRESISDVSKVTSSICDVIMARTFKHETIQKLAKYSSVPVINALSDLEHPCQILADFMTIYEEKNELKGLNISYLGDGENNVVHSMSLASSMLSVNFSCASPKGYEMNDGIYKQSLKLAKFSNCRIMKTQDVKKAIKNSDVVVTDTWVSMGDEAQKKKRLKIFKPYQVNREVFSLAKKDAIFLHCLPAYRGSEVTCDIIDGAMSRVFQEAENRLHTQKALLLYLFDKI